MSICLHTSGPYIINAHQPQRICLSTSQSKAHHCSKHFAIPALRHTHIDPTGYTLAFVLSVELPADMLVAEVDLKLLLAIQYVCEKAYIAVPWDDVARVMGPATTGSDILDYLASTRTQMVARGLDVPPPLNLPGKIEKVNRESPHNSNSSDDDDEARDVDDSDIKYGEPMAKRAKMSTKDSSKRKVHDDTDDGEHMNAEIIITGQRRLGSEDDYASKPKTDPRALYKKGLVVCPPPVRKDVHEAVDNNRKVVDTVKSGLKHHHVKDHDVKDDQVKHHQTKGPDVQPPLNSPKKMKIDFLVSPTPANTDVPTTAVQKRKVVTNDKNFSGAHDWSMGNPIPHSYQSGLREIFKQHHERYPDPSNHISSTRQ